MVVDARTSNREYKKPYAGNNLDEDMARLAEALEAIDIDTSTLILALAGKAAAGDLAAYQLLSARNALNGYAGLDGAGKLTVGTLPILSGGLELLNQYLPGRLQQQAVLITDWNLAQAAGFYRGASGAANTPSAHTYVGIVVQYDANAILQQVWRANGTIAYQRFWNGTAWSTWARMYNTEADLDSRYALSTNLGMKLIADVTISSGTTTVDIATGGNRFMLIKVGRAQPLTDGAQFRFQFSNDGGSVFQTVGSVMQYAVDMNGSAADETAIRDVTNVLTAGLTGISSTTTWGGWCGEIRIHNANQPRPLVGNFEGAWRNGGAHRAIRGAFYDIDTTARTHYRLRFSGGDWEGGRVVAMGVI